MYLQVKKSKVCCAKNQGPIILFITIAFFVSCNIQKDFQMQNLWNLRTIAIKNFHPYCQCTLPHSYSSFYFEIDTWKTNDSKIAFSSKPSIRQWKILQGKLFPHEKEHMGNVKMHVNSRDLSCFIRLRRMKGKEGRRDLPWWFEIRSREKEIKSGIFLKIWVHFHLESLMNLSILNFIFKFKLSDSWVQIQNFNISYFFVFKFFIIFVWIFLYQRTLQKGIFVNFLNFFLVLYLKC